MPHPAPLGGSSGCDPLVFEPGSCTRVGGHIWQDGKAPTLRADPGDNHLAIVLENHPADSRVKIAEDGIVQTLNARMGTGGGMFPSYCVRMRAGCEGGGKGALIQTERSGTLCPGNDQTLFVPLKTK